MKYVKCESILIIEDDEAIRTSLTDVLISEGYKIQDAANGKIAFEVLETLSDSSLLLLDLMMPAMVRLEKRGYQGLLMVHDESLTENAKGSIKEFKKIMCEVPPWAKGMPIDANAWCGPRYRK